MSQTPDLTITRFNSVKNFMKPGDIGAEIGIFKGSFIDHLLSTQPFKLYVVDPWYRLTKEWKWAKGDMSTVRAFQAILEVFEPEISKGILEPRVEFSQEFLSSLPDDHLDWVYIDSSHIEASPIGWTKNWSS